MLVLVVGPSGAGKDTLINGARAEFAKDPRFVFPRRVVTRASVAELEDHESVSREEFALRQMNGAYALSWEAHGLLYGLPASIEADVAAGHVVVVNSSRSVVPEAQEKFSGIAVISIMASPEVRAERLISRGRESAQDVAERMRREVEVNLPDAIVVDNSEGIEAGVTRFTAALRALARN
ncbi:MAG TPA: phosphonate metabolism protein/1,5-bisphosphokinase (PRPP-forming) PhnN [Devosia sp.]|jgi:phosphonate metabolism protein PhnN/1,5-bisphosphokinase (PRPP-forming)|nr:phosphonate metabolism protein/1,5-bisphosphokinase (PRPP-forming) PhnN [Devosia sp.]